MKPFLDRWGDRAIADIRTADVQDLIADLQKPRVIGRRPGPRVLSAARVNRIVDLLRHMLNWAVGREYIERTPFKRGSETLIKKLREDNKRRRRIDETEEAALLSAATPHIQALLSAAIDTGMRQGEMLAVRFADVDLERGLITLRGETTKSRKTRVVPISAERLGAVIEWLRLEAEGDEKPEEALVFSNVAGEPLRLFHRTWVSLVIRAHDLTPTWAPRTNYQGLSDASQDAFRWVNLRWHDTRPPEMGRLLGSTHRGFWKLTDAGRAFAQAHPARLTEPVIEELATKNMDVSLKPATTEPVLVVNPVDGKASPDDRLEQALGELRQAVAAELLDELSKVTPQYFETIVLDLVHRMGYGASRDDLQRVGAIHRANSQDHGRSPVTTVNVSRHALMCALPRRSLGMLRCGRDSSSSAYHQRVT